MAHLRLTTSVGSDCSGLQAGVFVCVGTGLIPSCKTFYQVVRGDTCQKIVDKHGTFTLDNFYSWNPAVGSDCSGLQAGVFVCVGVRGTPTTRPTNTAPSPTQTGLIPSCKTFYQVVRGDTCQKIVDKYGTFTLQDFFAWNPAVGTDCSGLQAGVYVCVGIPGTPTAPSTAFTTSTTTSSVSAPSPTQPGIIASCNKYYQVQSGDNCEKIVAAHGYTFTLQQFYSWNAGVGDTTSVSESGEDFDGVVSQEWLGWLELEDADGTWSPRSYHMRKAERLSGALSI
ncbi:hypothetical protein VTJ49DRAFT_6258 [Mycothermus thermophilus]|uniref:LysM domain-containing protein n=1 Tax=Humicola insolens TaxID=85995 RepID=A0ABR3V2F2_HUMIN